MGMRGKGEGGGEGRERGEGERGEGREGRGEGERGGDDKATLV